MTLSVEEATKAVLAAGYRSGSLRFRKIVNITLSCNSRCERVSRDRYMVKEGAGAKTNARPGPASCARPP